MPVSPGGPSFSLLVERRSSPRRPVRVKRTCSGPWGASECLVVDVSETGLGIVTGQELKLGDEVLVDWESEKGSDRPSQIACRVAHQTHGRVGLAFVRADEAVVA